MAKVRKRTWKNSNGTKSTCWFIDFIDNSGNRIRKSGFNTKVEAEFELIKLLAEVNSGTFTKENKSLTFQNAADNYLKLHAQLHCKTSTLDFYNACLKKHLLPYFGSMKLVDITPNKINQFMSQKVQEGLAPKSVNHFITLLGSVIQKMVDDEIIAKNPVSKVKRLKLPYREMGFYNQEEIEIVLEVAEKHYPDFYPLNLLQYSPGMRRGELLALTWNDINWQSRKIKVSKTLFKGQITSPKTSNSVRAVDMSNELIKVLKGWKLKCPNSEKDLIFPNQEGNYLDADNMVKRRFTPVLRKAGLNIIRFHDLRHTYASLLIAQNIPIKYIQRQMGHGSIQVTMDTYGHIMPEVNQQGINALDNLFETKKIKKDSVNNSSIKPKLFLVK